MYFLVSRKARFIFGWSAKCACTEIKRWYARVCNLDISNQSLHETIGYGNSPYTRVGRWPYLSYRKFILIRNPYKRLVSGYVNKYVIEKSRPNHGWDTFATFIDFLERDQDFKYVDKHHFVAQTGEQFGLARRRRWRWNDIVNVDTMSTDMARINQRLGVQAEIGHSNETPRQKLDIADAYTLSIAQLEAGTPDYASFYNDELRERVRRHYAADFDYFESLGFEFTI